MVNIHSQKQLFAAQLHACIFAAKSGFPHLSVADIIEPPHQWFDAALARQVVVHLMVHEFAWPKRRVVQEEERSREAVNRALRTVDARLAFPHFAAHYRSMADQARTLLTNRLTETEEDA
jgi:hypothetical protein